MLSLRSHALNTPTCFNLHTEKKKVNKRVGLESHLVNADDKFCHEHIHQRLRDKCQATLHFQLRSLLRFQDKFPGKNITTPSDVDLRMKTQFKVMLVGSEERTKGV